VPPAATFADVTQRRIFSPRRSLYAPNDFVAVQVNAHLILRLRISRGSIFG
jgi:hypothetical protein